MTVPKLREEARLRDSWLAERLDTIVPALMEREGIDAWVLAAREYNEDPVLATMLPATWMSARRRTVLVFTDRGRVRHAVARYDAGAPFPRAWDPVTQPDQWTAVADLLTEADPATIAVDRSPTTALADGMSASEHEALIAALPPSLRNRLVPADALAVGWLETRIPAETEAFTMAAALGHQIIAEGLSNSAIAPGTTTTEDLEWWFRDKVRSLGLTTWFQPAVSVQRPGGTARISFADHPGRIVIDRGDLVHVDFGIIYLGLHTDQQQHAYVLGDGETGVPSGLASALAEGNRLQDILLGQFAEGHTGNQALAAARAEALSEGLRPTIYSHPIGLHGHAAGPSIGLWDQQDGVPGDGDLPIRPATTWSIELNVQVDIEEWGGRTVSIMLEEDARFDGTAVEWLDGRQTAFHLVR